MNATCVLGKSETIEQLLKMSWTFVNDRSANQSAAADLYISLLCIIPHVADTVMLVAWSHGCIVAKYLDILSCCLIEGLASASVTMSEGVTTSTELGNVSDQSYIFV